MLTGIERKHNFIVVDAREQALRELEIDAVVQSPYGMREHPLAPIVGPSFLVSLMDAGEIPVIDITTRPPDNQADILRLLALTAVPVGVFGIVVITTIFPLPAFNPNIVTIDLRT